MQASAIVGTPRVRVADPDDRGVPGRGHTSPTAEQTAFTGSLLSDALVDAVRPVCCPTPLDVLGAETDGMIGYLIEQELGNLLSPGPLTPAASEVDALSRGQPSEMCRRRSRTTA